VLLGEVPIDEPVGVLGKDVRRSVDEQTVPEGQVLGVRVLVRAALASSGVDSRSTQVMSKLDNRKQHEGDERIND
jgi:hypothetical protein